MNYTYEEHAPLKLYRGLPYLVCKYCGLVYLKNDLTKWCIRMGCNHTDHPKYKDMLRSK